MVKSFKSSALRKLWNDGEGLSRSPKGIDPKSIERIKLLLNVVSAATKPSDLSLPGLGFHQLKGDCKGTYALEIRAQWRLTFGWDSGAINLDDEDYYG